jgi:transcriptional regulatory protein LevR
MKEYGKGAKGIDMSLAIKVSNRVQEQPAKEVKDDLSNKEKVQGVLMLITLPTLILLADIIGGIFHLWG